MDESKIPSSLMSLINHTRQRIDQPLHNQASISSIKELIKYFDEMDRKFLAYCEKELSKPKAPQHPPNHWYTTSQVLQQYPMCRRKLAQLRQKGEIPYAKIGSRCYYRLSDLERFMSLHMRHNSREE